MNAKLDQWYLLLSGARPAAENMAVDEVLLQTAPQLGKPVLRFYSWTEPAATFGYFQRVRDVQRMTPLRPLLRRPTGGGLVPHDSDWTYSLIFPPVHPWYGLKAVESYQRLHHWIQDAFGQNGVSTELADGPPKPSLGQCFIGAERFDVVWNQQKVAGAAQRRNRQGLLIQGSLQPREQWKRSEWEKAFCELASTQWKVEWVSLVIEPKLEDRIREMAKEKYGRDEYNGRR